MKNVSKLVSLVLAAMLVLGVFSAVSFADEALVVNGFDLSEEVALKTILAGDVPADQDLVYDEVNRVLKERLNTTMDIEYISWGDMGTKYQLLFAGGEDFDQVYTASWTSPSMKVLASKGAFMELTEEMLTTYAPNAYAQLPLAAIKQNQVDGKLYYFPKSASAYDWNSVVMIRGDLREKYGMDEITTFEQLNEYLHKVAENEEGIIPYQIEGTTGQLIQAYYCQINDVVGVGGNMYIRIDDDDVENPYFVLDDEKYIDYLKTMKEWHDVGILPADAASATANGNGDMFVAGSTAMAVWNVNIMNAYYAVMANNPEWKPEIIDVGAHEGSLAFATPYRDGIAINPESENWERCLMVQEQLRTDKYLWDTSNYGIEGVHWQAVGDDRYITLEDQAKFPANNSCQWGWQTAFQRVSDSYPDSYAKIDASWQASDYMFLLNGFSIDTTSIKNLQASMDTLTSQYINPLTVGAYDDVDATVAEAKAAFEAAGLEEYMTEVIRQMKEFAATMK